MSRTAPLRQSVVTLGALAEEPKLADQWLEITGAGMSTSVFVWLMLNDAPLWTKVLAIGSAGLRAKSIRKTYNRRQAEWAAQQA